MAGGVADSAAKRRKIGEAAPASVSFVDSVSSKPLQPDKVLIDVESKVLQHVSDSRLDRSYVDAIMSMNVFVTEIVDDEATAAPSYRRTVGQMGGLHPSRHGGISSVHVQIPGITGMYLLKGLHKYPHYQIPMSDLPDFVKELNGIGLQLYEADSTLPDDSPAAFMYFPSKTYSIADSPFVQYGSKDSTNDDLFSEFEKELGPSAIAAFIAKASSSDVSADRGNPRLDFSYTPLNATDRINPRYAGHVGPRVVTSHDGKVGWASQDRTKDMASAMVAVSKMMDAVTDALNLGRLMANEKRSEMFSHQIGKLSGRNDYRRNKAEGISMSVSSNKLLCHLDHLNDITDSFDWNASYYGIFPNPNSSDENDEPKYLRLHVGIYSRRICGATFHKVEDSVQVAKDLDSWLEEMIKTCPDRE